MVHVSNATRVPFQVLATTVRERQGRLVSYCRVARLDSMVNISELSLAIVRFEGAEDTLALTKR